MTRTATISHPSVAARCSVDEAFRHCEALARSHYENFPVASFFLPKHLRPLVAAVYAFARTADDFADEGTLLPEERLSRLDEWQQHLDACYDGAAAHPVFIALAEVVRRKQIPKKLFSDLLTAFRMDVTTTCYDTFDELQTYCRHSANPVGRIVLHLFDDTTGEKSSLSDHICTALQLANFWQDVRVDAQKGRIYLPLEDMRRFGYTETDVLRNCFDDRFVELMEFEVARTKAMFDAGLPLLGSVTPQLRFELLLTWNGGVTILKKIEQQHYNVFAKRPAISAMNKLSIVIHSFLHRTL